MVIRIPPNRARVQLDPESYAQLPPQVRRELKEIDWIGRELAKLARAEGQAFDCAPWVHKAREMPKDQFKREVEKDLNGRETKAEYEKLK